MTIELLGADRSGDSLHFTRGTHQDALDITPAQLSILRMRIIREDRTTVPFDGVWLDESEVTTLIKAWDEHLSGFRVQPIYPLESCRHCDVPAVTIVDWDPLCSGHASGLALRESEVTG